MAHSSWTYILNIADLYSGPSFEAFLEYMKIETLDLIQREEKQAQDILIVFIIVYLVVGWFWLNLITRFSRERDEIRKMIRKVPY